MTTRAEVLALVARLEAKGISQPTARTALEGGTAVAHVGAHPASSSLPARGLRPVEERAVAAALNANIPPRLRQRFAVARATHQSERPLDGPERVEQVILAEWLDEVLPRPKWCHVPNERSSAAEAGQLAAEGVKSGVPDVLIFARVGARAGVAIELKAPQRRREHDPYAGASESQRAWGQSLIEEGWLWTVCYSADEAAEVVIREYEVTP
jgi:hypothetical protein